MLALLAKIVVFLVAITAPMLIGAAVTGIDGIGPFIGMFIGLALFFWSLRWRWLGWWWFPSPGKVAEPRIPDADEQGWLRLAEDYRRGAEAERQQRTLEGNWKYDPD